MCTCMECVCVQDVARGVRTHAARCHADTSGSNSSVCGFFVLHLLACLYACTPGMLRDKQAQADKGESLQDSRSVFTHNCKHASTHASTRTHAHTHTHTYTHARTHAHTHTHTHAHTPSRPRRPKDKQAQADQKKAKFFQPEGDHLTLLAVYDQWKANKFSVPWCKENYVQVGPGGGWCVVWLECSVWLEWRVVLDRGSRAR